MFLRKRHRVQCAYMHEVAVIKKCKSLHYLFISQKRISKLFSLRLDVFHAGIMLQASNHLQLLHETNCQKYLIFL